ncbi:hypothetical protein ACPA5B_27385 [Pseudomonas solani]|uniref:hypothetical protein n=1 Tax=Pseudomonas solani TaxID=2731552 RepID=UPI003C2AC293
MQWKTGVLLVFALSAGSALGEPETDAKAHAPEEDCTLKRDGAACSEQDPIFQQVMDELNRERREAGSMPQEKDRGERVP